MSESSRALASNKEVANHIREYVTKNSGLFRWATDGCSYEQHMKFVRHRNRNWRGESHEEWVEFVLAYADKLEKEVSPIGFEEVGK